MPEKFDKVLTVKISKSLEEKVIEICETQGSTKSSLIRCLIENGLSEFSSSKMIERDIAQYDSQLKILRKRQEELLIKEEQLKEHSNLMARERKAQSIRVNKSYNQRKALDEYETLKDIKEGRKEVYYDQTGKHQYFPATLGTPMQRLPNHVQDFIQLYNLVKWGGSGLPPSLEKRYREVKEELGLVVDNEGMI